MWTVFQKYQPAAAEWNSAGGAAKAKIKHGSRNVSISDCWKDAHCWRIKQKQKEEVVQCCSRDVITVILSSRTTVWNYRADPLWCCSELHVGITQAFLLLAARTMSRIQQKSRRDEDGWEGERINSWRREEGRSTAASHWVTDYHQLISSFHRNKTKECN